MDHNIQYPGLCSWLLLLLLTNVLQSANIVPLLPLQGREQNKPEVTPLHIQNPFETSLNVSKNVNASQLERFVALCQESTWLLQQRESNTPRRHTEGNTTGPWGLVQLLMPLQVAGVKSRKGKRREAASERIKSLLESLKNKN